MDLGDSGDIAGLAVATCEGCSSHSLLIHMALNSHHYAHDTTDETENRKRPPEPCEIVVVVVTIIGSSAYAVVPTAAASAIVLIGARSSITCIVSISIIAVITTKHGCGNSEEVCVFHSNYTK